MKGKLDKTEDCGWIVRYSTQEEYFHEDFLQLHPDDVNEIILTEQVFDNIAARILAYPDVDFEIVENRKMDGTARYAKIIKNQ